MAMPPCGYDGRAFYQRYEHFACSVPLPIATLLLGTRRYRLGGYTVLPLLLACLCHQLDATLTDD